MKLNLSIFAALLVTSILHVQAARAQQSNSDNLVISKPWSRATPGGAKVASGYMTIENKGSAPDRLVHASSDLAAKVEVHETATSNGVATMRELENGLPVAAGTSVKLSPGGYHLMLVGIKRPLKSGDKVPLTLEFEKAGKKDVALNVLAIGAKSPDDSGAVQGGGSMGHEMHMDHSKMKM